MKSSLGINILLMQTVARVFVSLACHRAEYRIGQECCPMCRAGTRVNKHCTEFRSTSCLPCDDGTFMDEPTGITHCFRCRICASGLRAKTACSPLSNAVCEPEEGYFCLEPKDGNCEASRKHQDCEPGQYIAQPGTASADAVCSPCAEGTFSNGTLSRCQPHTQCEQMDKDTVEPGTLQSDAICRERNSNTMIVVVSVLFLFVASVLIVGCYFFRYKKYNNASADIVNKFPSREMTQSSDLEPGGTSGPTSVHLLPLNVRLVGKRTLEADEADEADENVEQISRLPQKQK